MSTLIAKRWFNVEDYYRMVAAGILAEDDRVELIEGEIVEMSPIGSRHSACIDRVNKLFNRLGDQFIVRVQSPIRLSDFSEPQPDVSLLRPRKDFYARVHPSPADVLLLIEVADTSVEYDRKVKVPLYARAGIPEVWLIDLPQDKIEIYAQPNGGLYQKFQQLKPGESFVSQTLPDLQFDVDALLG